MSKLTPFQEVDSKYPQFVKWLSNRYEGPLPDTLFIYRNESHGVGAVVDPKSEHPLGSIVYLLDGKAGTDAHLGEARLERSLVLGIVSRMVVARTLHAARLSAMRDRGTTTKAEDQGVIEVVDRTRAPEDLHIRIGAVSWGEQPYQYPTEPAERDAALLANWDALHLDRGPAEWLDAQLDTLSGMRFIDPHRLTAMFNHDVDVTARLLR